MFIVHYKNNRVYLVFRNHEDSFNFFEEHRTKAPVAYAGGWCIEFVPITETPAEAHSAALARGHLWDRSVQPVETLE